MDFWKRRWLITMAIALVGGCAPEEVPSDKGPAFRLTIFDLYTDLRRPSCNAPSGFSREHELGAERQRIEAFARSLAGTTAAIHFALAKADAEYAVATSPGCWADDDLGFARLHVQITKDRAKAALQSLPELSKDLPWLGSPQAVARAGGAAYRARVRAMLGRLDFKCAPSSTIRTEVTEPANRLIDRYRRQIDSTPYAIQFDVARADELYREAGVIVECGEPTPGQRDPSARDIELAVASDLAALRSAQTRP